MTVFISRDLGPNSIFQKQLKECGLAVKGQSFLKFLAVDFGEVPTVDWIFCYSARGFQYLLSGLERQGRNLPRGVSWAAMGPKTAKRIQEVIGNPPNFIGEGSPKEIAHSFLSRAAGKSVLFPAARHSLRSVENVLGSQIQSFPLIVYDNISKTRIAKLESDILVFTSPLNAQTYFSHHSLDLSQQAVAIGETTAKALQQLGIRNVIQAEEPSEEGLAKAVLGLF